MSKVTPTSLRKTDHIRINLVEDVHSGMTNGLEQYHFIHEALPELNLSDIDLSLNFLGKTLRAPILISSMTGGTSQAEVINKVLATAAQEMGVAMGLGSQRAAIEEPSLASTFQVRKEAPNILLFANLGAIQLNYGYGVEHCLRAVEMVGADALILHLNPLQEAVQPEGDTNFAGLLKKIETVCKKLPVPVIVKEVGWGFSGQTAVQLSNTGISVLDVAGAGGTSWTQVEKYRAEDSSHIRLASAFRNWGIPTAESIRQVREACPDLSLIASGGIRNGVEIAKAIGLGAELGGMAGPFLKSAVQSVEATIQTIRDIQQELRVTLFATGTPKLDKLPEKLVKTKNY